MRSVREGTQRFVPRNRRRTLPDVRRRRTVRSTQEKAANLLYQVVKDHPFSDGNKRCAAALFVYFLNGNSILGDDDSPACGG
ncbi:Fic family protein [Bifidobacterium longum]|uniref:Fic family protein n=1 Tax=Bifidobacterium longum TaxID=216816 RepID=UPI002E77C0BB|nr:Fic family protein [Bifidobacterium longum]